MTEQEHYARSWRTLRLSWGALYASFGIVPLAVVGLVLTAREWPRLREGDLLTGIAFALILPIVVPFFCLVMFKCPRCRKLFHGGKETRLQASECQHCGLEKDIVP